MGERLHLHAELAGRLREVRDLGEGQLARERDAARAEPGRGFDAGGVMGVHLGGDVQARLGQGARELCGHADVLHDERVGTGAVGLARGLERALELGGQHGRVERHVHARAAQMRVVARLGERGQREVVGAAAGVERLEAQVYRVGTGAHGGAEGLGVAGGREEFDIVGHGVNHLCDGKTFNYGRIPGLLGFLVYSAKATIRLQRYASIIEP